MLSWLSLLHIERKALWLGWEAPSLEEFKQKLIAGEDSGFVHPEVEAYTILVNIFKKKNIYLQIKNSLEKEC